MQDPKLRGYTLQITVLRQLLVRYSSHSGAQLVRGAQYMLLMNVVV